MLRAQTVRRLNLGMLEQFQEAFRPGGGRPARLGPGFHLLRGLADENEIATFGFFVGTLEELERSQAEDDYESRRAAIEPYVDAVIANGAYEVEVSWVPEGAPAT